MVRTVEFKVTLTLWVPSRQHPFVPGQRDPNFP
jgi:hypothetical protein